MKSESEIEQQHRQDAEACGWFVDKIERTSRNGFPDRFYAKGGRIVLIEWKRPGAPLRKQQVIRQRQLRMAGVEVYTIDNVVEANRILGIGT